MLGGLIFAGAGLPAGPSDLAAGTSAASDLTDLTDLSLGAKTAATAPEAAGGLRVIGSGFSASERGAAEALAGQGRNVVLREATGVGRTSDLLVDGIPYDVYTPTTGNLNRVVSAIASKGSQVNGAASSSI